MDKEKLKAFVRKIKSFDDSTHVEKIIVFGYYLINVDKQDDFDSKSILNCYKSVDKSPPKNISDFLNKMYKSDKLVLADGGYRVEGSLSDKLERDISTTQPTLAVSEKLWELHSKLEKPEKDFFEEALDCLSMKAWRAVIVLVWIITMDHLQNYVITKKLSEFNRILSTPPGFRKINPITNREDFENIKESDFIHVLRTANLISKNQKKILDQRLDFRNTYAHASSQILHESTATSFVEDLIDNIVLKIK